jgi:hypothetical protein
MLFKLFQIDDYLSPLILNSSYYWQIVLARGKKYSTFRLQQERLMTIVMSQLTHRPETLIDIEPCLLRGPLGICIEK